MRLIDSFKPAELAAELGVAVSTLAGWRSKGTGPRHVLIAGRVHYLRTDVEQWLTDQINAA